MTEADILRSIQALSVGDVRLWRNNCGAFKDPRGQWVRYGIPGPGGSDLIGLRSVIVTPDMVGQRVAIFTALEVKSPRGVATAGQRLFISAIAALGGHAGIARSAEDAKLILRI